MHFHCLYFLLSIAVAAPLFRVKQDTAPVHGEYIVKFKQDVSDVYMLGLKQSLTALPTFEYSLAGFNGFAGFLNDAELIELQTSEQVDYISPDDEMQAYDPFYQKQATWGISRLSHDGPGNNTFVFDDSAGEGTCAYVIDTGATFLANFSQDDDDEDGEGHGTHVAGTIGSRGTYGVAKKTQLYAVKVLDSYGSGTTSGIIAGINFLTKDAATRNCPKGTVANMSLGGRKNVALDQAVAAGVSSGIFFAVAAGNEGQDARYVSPASEPSICTVGAMSMNDSITSWSNYGKLVDVLAPGMNITSLNNDGTTAMHDGTSMASPHVAGLAAYLLGLNGGSTTGLCEKIASLGLKNVIKNVESGTANILINNGAA